MQFFECSLHPQISVPETKKCHIGLVLMRMQDDALSHSCVSIKTNNQKVLRMHVFICLISIYIGPACQSFADKVASLVYCCFHAVKVRSIFATKAAFNSVHKDVLPIFNQSLLIYKFKCWYNSTYIGRTSQCLEVRVRQHVLEVF